MAPATEPVILVQIWYSVIALVKRDLGGLINSPSSHSRNIMKTCTFVTGNPNKVIEVNAILGDSIPIRALALDIPEIQGSLEDIARDKCRRAAKMVIRWLLDCDYFWISLTSYPSQVNGPVIVEDSALEFHAMNRLPGPYM